VRSLPARPEPTGQPRMWSPRPLWPSRLPPRALGRRNPPCQPRQSEGKPRRRRRSPWRRRRRLGGLGGARGGDDESISLPSSSGSRVSLFGSETGSSVGGNGLGAGAQAAEQERRRRCVGREVGTRFRIDSRLGEGIRAGPTLTCGTQLS
jgi:hypothetical protein